MIACKFEICDYFQAWNCLQAYLYWTPKPDVRVLAKLNHANPKFINSKKIIVV
jgi:hypothetical protein